MREVYVLRPRLQSPYYRGFGIPDEKFLAGQAASEHGVKSVPRYLRSIFRRLLVILIENIVAMQIEVPVRADKLAQLIGNLIHGEEFDFYCIIAVIAVVVFRNDTGTCCAIVALGVKYVSQTAVYI